MYDWRKMTDADRKEVLDSRMVNRNPWYRPPNFEHGKWFLVSAACFEHRHLIGSPPKRMASFSEDLLRVFSMPKAELVAWVLLPNHYHVLTRVNHLPGVRKVIGQLHGGSSHRWNVEEGRQGRKCFHGALFKAIKSEAHRISTLNYIHHNPVRHGYVKKWEAWPFGSAREYLKATPPEIVKQQWIDFPVTGMGEGWDEEAL
ncbi:MAG: transposase [Kiritimatiellia bacterium]